MASSMTQNTPSRLEATYEEDDGFVDIPDGHDPRHASPVVPKLFTEPPPVHEDYSTHTLTVQTKTMNECVRHLAANLDEVDYNHHGVPRLRRAAHIKFLKKQLGTLPAPFLVADASRPWFLFWCLNGLALAGEDTTSYRQQVIVTAKSMQNPTGGFGGGHGQMSHLATTFAVVLALALVGGEEAYEVIDRKSMWRWLCSLKQPDGGVQMVYGGEVDVRGAYCTAVIVGLLNMPRELSPDSPAYTPDGKSTLFTGLAEFVRRCQTFEGGISGRPDAEAHGAYAFCALACLAILDAPHRIIPKYLDVPRLIAWLSSLQYAPEGGFCGRTNKLVDGCYSHWVGGCWPLIDAALNGTSDLDELENESQPTIDSIDWYNREGLIRYILCCAQDESKRGGLRDKPSSSSDAYHSCYVLSGLSTAQYKWGLTYLDDDEMLLAEPKWKVTPRVDDSQIYDKEDRVQAIHPTYTIPDHMFYDMQGYFASKAGF
ncbi:hypothetical protein ACRALDRAFT_1057121 [Sodiomyces alcalophilus JCM 7366]|uniref:uncharacterized protein n=1 Tax=Sodiomyces alcalophilus JCM 7366 TaxID=591952 RepID=UPI0039B44785